MRSRNGSGCSLPVEEVVQDLNRFLRGWAGYFRYGHSARHFDRIGHYAIRRLALFVAKRHKRARGYGMTLVAYHSPESHGADHPARNRRLAQAQQALAGKSRMPAVKDVGEPCAGEPHARFEVAAGGIWRAVGNAVRALAPPADPTFRGGAELAPRSAVGASMSDGPVCPAARRGTGGLSGDRRALSSAHAGWEGRPTSERFELDDVSSEARVVD